MNSHIPFGFFLFTSYVSFCMCKLLYWPWMRSRKLCHSILFHGFVSQHDAWDFFATSLVISPFFNPYNLTSLDYLKSRLVLAFTTLHVLFCMDFEFHFVLCQKLISMTKTFLWLCLSFSYVVMFVHGQTPSVMHTTTWLGHVMTFMITWLGQGVIDHA